MPSVSNLLTSRMNYLVARQGVVAGNIANADTPGYRARDLVDAGANGDGRLAMTATQAGHVGGDSATGQGKIVEDSRFIQHNGNSVRLDQEMLKMSDLQLDYRMMTQVYAKQVALQKMALGARQ